MAQQMKNRKLTTFGTKSAVAEFVFERNRLGYIETAQGQKRVRPVYNFRPKIGVTYPVDLQEVLDQEGNIRYLIASPRVGEHFFSNEEVIDATQLIREVEWGEGREKGRVVAFDLDTGMAIVPNTRAFLAILGHEPKVGERSLISLRPGETCLVAKPLKAESEGGLPMVIAAEAANNQSEFERRHVLTPDGKWKDIFVDVLKLDPEKCMASDINRAVKLELAKDHPDTRIGLPPALKDKLDAKAQRLAQMFRETKEKAHTWLHMYREGKCGWKTKKGQLCENPGVNGLCRQHEKERNNSEIVEAAESEA
ncbi:MAG: hypothetical protein Q7R79_01285 [bacterium]|nr:hypothetical protein [bacterium]